jgi:hypothetical protein
MVGCRVITDKKRNVEAEPLVPVKIGVLEKPVSKDFGASMGDATNSIAWDARPVSRKCKVPHLQPPRLLGVEPEDAVIDKLDSVKPSRGAFLNLNVQPGCGRRKGAAPANYPVRGREHARRPVNIMSQAAAQSPASPQVTRTFRMSTLKGAAAVAREEGTS